MVVGMCATATKAHTFLCIVPSLPLAPSFPAPSLKNYRMLLIVTCARVCAPHTFMPECRADDVRTDRWLHHPPEVAPHPDAGSACWHQCNLSITVCSGRGAWARSVFRVCHQVRPLTRIFWKSVCLEGMNNCSSTTFRVEACLMNLMWLRT